MTEADKKVYDFIVDYTRRHLYAPSIRDICKGCGYSSTSTVNAHLYKLQHKGLIKLGENGQPRCIKLVGFKLIKM